MTKNELIQRLVNPEKFLIERPAMNAFSEEEILEGIYTAFNLINAECTNLPIKVWEYNEPRYRPEPVPVEKDNPLYRNADEIDNFFQAVIYQTQYTLNMGNDYSQGSSTFSTGGMSATIQRPERRDILAPGVLLFLQSARLFRLQEYDLNQKNQSGADPCDELTKYLTYEEGDKRYVEKYQPNAPSGSICVINDNNIVSFEDPSTIDFKSYEADKIKDTDGQYKYIQNINNLAFYGDSGTNAARKEEVREMIDAAEVYDANWSYRRGEIVSTYNASKNYIDLWLSNYDNNIGHDPYLDNQGQYWWKYLQNKETEAYKIYDPVNDVYKMINQFDVHYFGGLTRQEIYDAIHASGTVWDENTRYRKDFVVIHVDNGTALNWYASLQDNNIGHNPENSPLWWKKLPIPAIDVSSVIEQIKPYVKSEVDKAVADAIALAKTGLTTDFSGSIYEFADAAAFDNFIASNPKLTADMFEDVDLTQNAVLLTGNQTIGGTKTFNGAVIVPTPNGAQHAANKAYVDTNTYSKTESDGKYVLKDNTANTVIRAPIVNLTATTGDLELRVRGANNSINCGNKRITGVATPTANDHAATKGYVDTNTVNPGNYYDRNYIDNNYYTRSYINNNYYTQSQSNARYYDKSTSDSKYVGLSNSQTISGGKTFSSTVVISAAGGINTNKIGTYSGANIYFSEKRLKQVASPAEWGDAANKGYVDDNFSRKSNNYVIKTQQMTFTCRDVSVSGSISKYYLTAPSTIENYKNMISIEIVGNEEIWTPVKATSSFVDLIGPNGAFRSGSNYALRVRTVSERTY